MGLVDDIENQIHESAIENHCNLGSSNDEVQSHDDLSDGHKGLSGDDEDQPTRNDKDERIGFSDNPEPTDLLQFSGRSIQRPAVQEIASLLDSSEAAIPITVPGDGLWRMLFTIRILLVDKYQERAPSLLRIYREYWRIARNAMLVHDLDHDGNFEASTAAEAMAALGREMLGEELRFAIVRPEVRGQWGQICDCAGLDGENQAVLVAMHTGALGAGHYEPMLNLRRGGVEIDQRRYDEINQVRRMEMNNARVQEIFHLERTLHFRNIFLPDMEAEELDQLLSQAPNDNFHQIVEGNYGPYQNNNPIARR